MSANKIKHDEATQSGHLETGLTGYLARLGLRSVFDAAAISRGRFVARHGKVLGDELAGQIHDAATARASLLARRHAEQALHRRTQQNAEGSVKPVLKRRAIARAAASVVDPSLDEKSSGKATDRLPTYDELFDEAWQSMCRPETIEAFDSPVAYLADIYKLATDIEADKTSDALTLAQRRPDLAALLLDDAAATQEMPTLALVNDILRRAIADGEGYSRAAHATLSQTRYPFNLPFDLPTRQIHGGLDTCDIAWGDLIRDADAGLPAFIPGADSDFSNTLDAKMSHAKATHKRALLAYGGLAPEQQLLVAEPPAFATGAVIATPGAVLQSPDITAMLPWHGTEAQAYRMAFRVPPQAGVTVTNGENLDQIIVARNSNATDNELTIDCAQIDANGDLDPAKTARVAVRVSNLEGATPRRVNNAITRKGKPFARAFRLEVTGVTGQEAGKNYAGALRVIGQCYQGDAFVELMYGVVVRGDESDNSADPTFNATIDYCKRHFGYPLVKSSVSGGEREHVDIGRLCYAASIDRATLDPLLASEAHAPVVSPNCAMPNAIFTNGNASDAFPAPYHYGAVYLHGGLCQRIGTTTQNTGTNADSDATSALVCGAHRLDRFNRLARIQQWLGLPADKTDLLLVSAARAEGECNLSLSLNRNTLRALGLFRHWQRRYGIEADAFAAVLHEISPFAAAGEAPFFDRVFNAGGVFDSPLVLDLSPFDFQAESGDDARTVKQLCAGLGISGATFARLAPRVQAAQQSAQNPSQQPLPPHSLRRSLPVVSALYRLVAVSRLFGLPPEEGVALLDLMDGGSGAYADVLAGVPHLSPLDAQGRPTEPDVLDILLAFESASQWLARHDGLTPSALAVLLGQNAPALTATPGTKALFDALAQLAQNALADDACLMRHGIPAFDKHGQAIDWQTRLQHARDARGALLPAMDDDAALAAQAGAALNGLALAEPREAVQARLADCLTQARQAQHDAVNAVIGKEYNVANQMPPLLLRWAGSNAHAVLDTALHQAAGNESTAAHVALLFDIARHAAVVNLFKLSAAAVSQLLAQPAWFGIAVDDDADETSGRPALSLRLVYLLSRYAELLAATPKDEDHLLAYLTHANAQEPAKARSGKKTSDDEAKTQQNTSHALLADLLGWDAGEAKNAAQTLPGGTASTLAHVDALMRMQALSRRTGLLVDSLQLAATLTPDGQFDLRQTLGNAVMAAARTRAGR